MNILILGQGGREHAFAWKIRQSPLCGDLFIAPGNGGTSLEGENIDIDLTQFSSIKDLIQDKKIELVVVGPEAPLAAGVGDYLADELPSVMVIGPHKEGAKLEASKAYAKAFMARHNIPTAAYQVVHAGELENGLAVIDEMNTPIVLKADGLAAGKGVVICDTRKEAHEVLNTMLNGQFGAASEKVVIESFLNGREYSVFALTNGDNYYLLPVAKDYKRIGEGDNGLNTGGMGAVSPVSYVDDVMMKKTIEQVVEPTIAGLRTDQIPYCGFIFFGLIEVLGEPFVIEYNCRMGDPETEAVLPRIESDLLAHFIDTCRNAITPTDLKVSPQACATVMLVSGGYPMAYQTGYEIDGCQNIQDSLVFHAGTVRKDERLFTNGGRVITISSCADKPHDAIKKSYETLRRVAFEKQYYRSDIGFDL